MMRIGIIGGTGYVGGELLRILLLHPQVEVTMVTSGKAPVNTSSTRIRTCEGSPS